MKQALVGAAISEAGELFAVATTRTKNLVYRFWEDSWEEHLAWTGTEVID